VQRASGAWLRLLLLDGLALVLFQQFVAQVSGGHENFVRQNEVFSSQFDAPIRWCKVEFGRPKQRMDILQVLSVFSSVQFSSVQFSFGQHSVSIWLVPFV